jgi:hypothetical protein
MINSLGILNPAHGVERDRIFDPGSPLRGCIDRRLKAARKACIRNRGFVSTSRKPPCQELEQRLGELEDEMEMEEDLAWPTEVQVEKSNDHQRDPSR